MSNKQYPKVGFAFSGSSSRSVFYIGFLEVLRENNFPIDFISAMSGAAIVAASYSCGTMEQLKQFALTLDKEVIFKFIETSKGKGGLYHLGKVEELMRQYTRNLNFEDVTPRLAFVATDITGGEEVVLQVGDIARSICASCALPAVFEPVKWGNKSLVDGGVINVLPGNVAADAGMDVVIGIDLRATRHVFSPWQIKLRRLINFFKRSIWPNQVEQLWQKLAELLDYSDLYPPKDLFEQRLEYPNMFAVLGRTMDIAIKAQERDATQDYTRGCDMVIVPESYQIPFWKKMLIMRFSHIGDTREYYESGRRTAKQYLPQLWQLLADFEAKQVQATKQIKVLLTTQSDD